jgi:hypothetical protein
LTNFAELADAFISLPAGDFISVELAGAASDFAGAEDAAGGVGEAAGGFCDIPSAAAAPIIRPEMAVVIISFFSMVESSLNVRKAESPR